MTQKKINRTALGVIFAMVMMFAIPLISAYDWDNVKYYNPATETVTITNALGLGENILTAQLLTPHNYKVIVGKDIKLAEVKIMHIAKEDVNITNIKLYDLIKGGNMDKQITLKYKSIIWRDDIVYTEECLDSKEINKTTGKLDRTCGLKETGVIKVNTGWEWKVFKDASELPDGEVIIGLFGDTYSGEHGEWIPNWGKEITEWTTWTTADCKAVGGNSVYIDGDYCVHRFDTNGSFNISAKKEISIDADNLSILVVAGGGGGLRGGGGAGGVVYNVTANLSNNISVKIGVGGLGEDGAIEDVAWNGVNSSFGLIQALGGGGGVWNNKDGVAGGSGGGAGLSASAHTGGTGYTGQGNDGGDTAGSASPFPAAGGGGKGTAGGDTVGNTVAGYGGNGTAYMINGTVVYYGGGGGGSCYAVGCTGGEGGLGGGADGLLAAGTGYDGINGTGGGGGGAINSEMGGRGGSGVVIVRYLAGGMSTMDIINSNPANNTNISASSVTFGCNATAVGQNITSIILNVTGAATWIQTASGLNNPSINQTFINNTLIDGFYNWNCVAFGSLFVNATSISWNFTKDTTGPSITIASPTGSYYTPPHNYSLNYTARDTTTSLSSCWYSYNGAANITIPSCNNISIKFNRLSWNSVWLYANDSLNNVNNTNVSFFLYPTLGICNETNEQQMMNISFKNEATSAEIWANLTASTIFYYDSNGSSAYSRTINPTNTTGANSYTLCSSPNMSSLNITISNFQYSGSGFPSRTWSTASTTYTNTSFYNKTLYLLATADGIYVTFQVQSQAGQAIVNAVINMTTALGIVGETLTDAAGLATFWLNPNTLTTINVLKTGYALYESSIYPTQTQYTISLGAGESNNVTNYEKAITYSFKPSETHLVNNTAYSFNFTISSSYWSLSKYGINITSNGTKIASASGTGLTGGTVNTTVNTGKNQTFIVTGYWIIEGNLSYAVKTYYIWDDSDTSWSLKNLGEDLTSYIDSGMFGLKKGFGLNIIIFLIIFIVTGILSWKFGIYSPAVVTTIIFVLTAFFDVALGFIDNPINAVPHFPTLFLFIITIALWFKEAYSNA